MEIKRNHQFDLLRILFAICVLLSHAAEVTDGNKSREILARLTHSDMTFGALGVDGFFLLSGYLIVKSWMRNPNLLDYMRNRILRIVPGYLVAAILSTIAVGLLAPGVEHFFRDIDIRYFHSLVALGSPATPPVFPGSIYPLVNGALWSVQYEFRCYVLVAIFGLSGILKKPLIWLAMTAFLMTSLIRPFPLFHWHKFFYSLIGEPKFVFYLTGIYLLGGCFFLFKIPFRPPLAAGAVAAIVAFRIFDPLHIQFALVVFGGYLMFYFGQMSVKFLDWMKNVPDISYGIYIYGWPVECLLIYYRHGSPWVTFLVAAPICFGLGWLSWHFVERPALSLKKKRIFLPSSPILS
jgi:peptidoglycan/LPS O-acetylase OafA/YrhL